MATINVSGFRIILPDFSFSEKYWTFLSSHVIDTYGEDEIDDSELVQKILKECFQILINHFEDLISQQNKASFLLAVHNYHENSVEIYRRQLGGEPFDLDPSEFATSRRVLKLILEQVCKNNLVGAQNFAREIASDMAKNDRIIEELLYLGYWSIGLADYIATSQLFPGAIGIQIEKETLEILKYPPYNKFIDFYLFDLSNHDGDVVLQNTINELKSLLKDELELDYDILTAIVPASFDDPQNRFAIVKYQELINQLVTDYNYNKEYIEDFYAGLTISTENALSIEESILRNQHENRIVYRPIIQLTIDKQKYWVIGNGKWSESLATLTTNALPFGKCPKEWLKYPVIDKFIKKVSNYHDKVLEDPIENGLAEHGIKYDRNLKSLRKSKSEYIRIDKAGVGEIDFIFIDEEYDIIYVLECKHNRSRFDMFNWRRDYENFKRSYEHQLENKINWCRRNINIINFHFSNKYNDPDLNINNFLIRGVFVINAPTIYMLNGKFRAFTLRNFRDLLNRDYIDRIFSLKYENGKEVLISHPYFDNLKKRLKLDNLAEQISKLSIKESMALTKLVQEILGG